MVCYLYKVIDDYILCVIYIKCMVRPNVISVYFINIKWLVYYFCFTNSYQYYYCVLIILSA